MNLSNDGLLGDHFHDIMNHFPHCYLSTHKRSIPISLVHVFVAIARRLGIAASPVNFPARVLVHAFSPGPHTSEIYVDVFGSHIHPILSATEDIPQMLLRAGVSPYSIGQYLSPCPAAPMLLRAARNILGSYRLLLPDSSTVPEADIRASINAALSIQLLLTNEPRFISPMIQHILLRPLDCATVLSNTLAPLLQPRAQEMLEAACKSVLKEEEEAAAVISLRSSATVQIKFFVGMVFEHIKFGYLGCIIRWEV